MSRVKSVAVIRNHVNIIYCIQAGQSGTVAAIILPRTEPADVTSAPRGGAADVTSHVNGGVRQTEYKEAVPDTEEFRLTAAEETIDIDIHPHH